MTRLSHKPARSPALIRAIALCAVAGIATVATTAGAQTAGAYPNRSIRVVLPAAAGSLTDPVGRVITDEMARRTGQPWIVDNRPGAGGIIGSEQVFKAPPDGYTLLFTANNFIITPSLYSGTVPYKVAEDFTPIGLVARGDNLLVASSATGVKNIGELVALAKKTGGGLNYTSPLLGSAAHLTVELFKRVAGIPLNHVAYKDATQGTGDTLTGRIAVNIMGVSTALPHIRAGRLVPLAWTGSKRIPALPDTPTFVEAGYKEVHMGLWFGYFGPARLPAGITGYLNAQLNEALKAPGVVEKLANMSIEPLGGSAADLGRVVASETPVYAKLAAETGIKLD